MVSEIYGEREDVPIEANIEFGLGTDDLRELLEESTDLFHYIGHVDERGFDCIDGFLDAESLDDVELKAFLLNACHSLSQGEALVEAGASAGIVSLSEVGNRSAIEFGKTLAKLFYHGFSVGTALGIAGRYTDLTSRYIVLGDVGLMLAKNENDMGIFYDVIKEEKDRVSVDVYSHPNRDFPIGSLIRTYLQPEVRYVNSGHLKTVDISIANFKNAVGSDIFPLIADGNLIWSDKWLQEREL
jgi:hypothetical protein